MKNKTNIAGFTLVEVTVATFLFGAIVALVSGFAVYYFQTYSFSFEQNQSINVAQQSLTRMIREIREIRIGENGEYPIVDPQNNSFTFFADVTNDGRTDKVRYFLDGSQIKRGIIEPTEVPVSYLQTNEKVSVIADSVDLGTKNLFTYYNGNWPADTIHNPLTLTQRLVNTRYVEVYIRINIQTNTGSQPFELSSGVQIRSLKDNL